MKCGLHQFIFQRRHADTSIALTTRPLPFESGSLLIAGGAAGRTAVIHLPFSHLSGSLGCSLLSQRRAVAEKKGSQGRVIARRAHSCVLWNHYSLLPPLLHNIFYSINSWRYHQKLMCAYWISLGFFYVVICLDNIFADSSIMLIDHLGHRIAVLKLSFFDLVHPFFFFWFIRSYRKCHWQWGSRAEDPTPAYFSVLSKERFTHLLSSIL